MSGSWRGVLGPVPGSRLYLLRLAQSPVGRPNFSGSFRLGKTLGEGAYGSVKICEELKSGKRFACKVVNKSRLSRQKDLVRARLEFLVHRQVADHPSILGVEDLYEDKEQLYLVLELCEGGDLFDYLSRRGGFSEKEAAAIFRQIVGAVQACHLRGIMHRDLKLENFLLRSGAPEHCHGPGPGVQPKDEGVPRICIADFGSALMLSPGEKASGAVGGSKMYQAPQILRGLKYDFKADIWSLGVILFSLLSSSFPFLAPTEGLLTGMIRRGIYTLSSPRWNTISNEGKDLVRQLLQVDPDLRPSTQGILCDSWLVRHQQSKKRKVPCHAEGV